MVLHKVLEEQRDTGIRRAQTRKPPSKLNVLNVLKKQ